MSSPLARRSRISFALAVSFSSTLSCFHAATTLSLTSASVRSRVGGHRGHLVPDVAVAADLHRLVLDADVGLEGAHSGNRCRRAGRRPACRPCPCRSCRPRRSATSFSPYLAAISFSVEPPARASSMTSCWSGFRRAARWVAISCFRSVLRLLEGLDHLRLDRGDADDHRAEAAVDDAAHAVRLRARRPHRRPSGR